SPAEQLSPEDQRHELIKQMAVNEQALAFNVLKGLAAKPGNVVFSPLSIGTGLAMAQTGAKGETQVQLTKPLDYTGKPEEFAYAFGLLAMRVASLGQPTYPNAGMTVEPDFTWKTANRGWSDKGLPIERDYTTATQRYFRATMLTANFADKEG